jgi:hypothetical protein
VYHGTCLTILLKFQAAILAIILASGKQPYVYPNKKTNGILPCQSVNTQITKERHDAGRT